MPDDDSKQLADKEVSRLEANEVRMDGLSADPAKTYAVLVGIEHYELATDLDGIAHDVHTFADWLIDRGVPPTNILPLISALEYNQALWDTWPAAAISEEIGGAGQTPRLQGSASVAPATEFEVKRALNKIVNTWEGDLLIAFCSGHSVLDAEDRRRLIYADSTKMDLTNLDVVSLLTRLRSDYGPRIARQIILVDACATEVQDMQFLDGRLTHGRRRDWIQQAVLFAARPGEAAAHLAREKTGRFTRELLEALKQRPGMQWPPDMDALADQLR